MPAEIESRMPRAKSVERSLVLKDRRAPMPMAMPTGVVTAYAPHMIVFCSQPAVVEGSSAMRAPSARPSKSWWKVIAMKSGCADE